MPVPPPTPAAAAETPALPTAEPATETAATTEPASTAEASTVGWTEYEDAALIGMKAQGKSWKEIHDVTPTRSKTDLKQRFKELSVDVKGKGKVVSSDEGSGQGKKEGKKGILKAGGYESDPTDDEGIDPRGLPINDIKSFKKIKKTGALKIIEVDSDEDEPADLRGHPIVYMDPEAGLSEAHVSCPFSIFLSVADTAAVDEDFVQDDAQERQCQMAGDRIKVL